MFRILRLQSNFQSSQLATSSLPRVIPTETIPIITMASIADLEKCVDSQPDKFSLKDDIYSSSSSDAANNGIPHVRLLKMLGAVTVMFSIIEACIGAVVYNFTVNYRLGAWWISILAFFAGLCAIQPRNRGWITGACVLASVSIAITVTGSIVDSVAVSELNELSACVRRNPNNVHQHYGYSGDYSKADSCLATASSILGEDDCYCVNRARDTCYEFSISSSTKFYGMGCGNVINTYIKLLLTSAALSILTSICVTIISVVSCTMLCCSTVSTRVQYRRKKMGVKKVHVLSVTGEEDNFS